MSKFSGATILNFYTVNKASERWNKKIFFKSDVPFKSACSYFALWFIPLACGVNQSEEAINHLDASSVMLFFRINENMESEI